MSATSPLAKTASLADLVPIDLVAPDGLIVTTDGRYVRLIECDRVPNSITADEGRVTQIERALRELCRAIPDRQSLAIYAQTDPVPIKDALAEDRARVAAARAEDLAEGRVDLARARKRFLAGLTQTVWAVAGAEQPAVAARWWVAVPYRPGGRPPPSQRGRTPDNRDRPGLRALRTDGRARGAHLRRHRSREQARQRRRWRRPASPPRSHSAQTRSAPTTPSTPGTPAERSSAATSTSTTGAGTPRRTPGGSATST